MPMKRYGVKKHAALEINASAFDKTTMVISQTPLASVFTAAKPAENGMWVNANRAEKTIGYAKDGEPVGILFTTEREVGYDRSLGAFSQVGGEMPRVGVLTKGEVFTSNCFAYDTTDFANEQAVDQALAGSAPLYLEPQATDGAPKLVKVKPSAKTYAQVIKATTMPNGEKAIKYTIVEA